MVRENMELSGRTGLQIYCTKDSSVLFDLVFVLIHIGLISCTVGGDMPLSQSVTEIAIHINFHVALCDVVKNSICNVLWLCYLTVSTSS